MAVAVAVAALVSAQAPALAPALASVQLEESEAGDTVEEPRS